MASVQTKFMVGLFLIAGTILSVAVVVWVGMSGYLEEGNQFVMYFNESVQGLDHDSTVKYRGVPIGKVETIGVAKDGKLIEIIVKIQKDLVPSEEVTAQLKSVGITGIMFIELDLAADKPGDKQDMDFKPPHPVIKTRLSGISLIFRSVETMFYRFQKMDIEGVILKIQRDLDSLDKLINDTDTKEISLRFVESLERLNKILEPERWDNILNSIEKIGPEIELGVENARKMFNRAEAILANNEKNLALAMEALKGAMEAAKSVVLEGENLVSGTDSRVGHLQHHLLVSAQNMEKATENLNRLLEILAQDPAQILLGQPPPPRSVESGGR